jgi:hypothetical protein
VIVTLGNYVIVHTGGGPGKRNGRKRRHPPGPTSVWHPGRGRSPTPGLTGHTLSRRGHRDDPLYKIRGLLHRGREHLSDKQVAKLNVCLTAGDPGWEVTLAWHAYRQLRSMYQAETPAAGRAIAAQVIASFHECPIPEVARLGRTLRMWKDHVPARFETHRISNGGTEAVNLIIEKTRRLAHGFRTFDHYRIRILGPRRIRKPPLPPGPTHA